jgi:hypothetical protein
MSDVFSFLFGLHGLSIFFVLAMAVIFVAGAIYSRIKISEFRGQVHWCQQNYGGGKYASRMTPQEYLRLHLDEAHASHLLAAIPGFLVSLGILGTFIGLGIAVGEASGAMAGDIETAESMAEMQAALNNLLTAISFKFQASAWGILSSLLFAATVQVRFGSELEVLIEDASRDLIEHYQTPSDAITLSLSGLGSELSVVLQESMQAMESKMTQPIRQLSARVAQLEGSLKVVEVAALKMKASAEDLGKLSGKIDTSLKAISKTIGDRLDQGNQQTRISLQKLEQSTAKSATQQSAAAEKMVKDIGSSLQTISKTIGAQLNRGNVQMETALNQLETSVSSTSKQQVSVAERQLKAMQGSLAKMQSSVQQSSKQQAAAADKMSGDVKAAIDSMHHEINALMKESNRIQGNAEDQMKRIGRAITTMDGTVKTVNTTIDKAASVNGRMVDVFQEMASVIGRIKLNAMAGNPSRSRAPASSREWADQSDLSDVHQDLSAPIDEDEL